MDYSNIGKTIPAIKLIGDRGIWTVNAGPFGKLPVLMTSTFARVKNRRALLNPVGPQKRSAKLGTYHDALANASHVVLCICGSDSGDRDNREYLGVWRVSGFTPETVNFIASIVIHEQVAAAA